MPLHLLDGMEVRDEDLTEFRVWIYKDTAKEAPEPDPDADPDDGIEKITFFLRPLSGYEIERAGNRTGLTKGQGRGDGQEKRTDGTSSLDHIAKILVRIEPAPVGTDGQPRDKISLDLVRGLPAWILMRITEHMDLAKKKQENDEKN